MEKMWQVWTQDEDASRKAGLIVNENVIFYGTEKACRRFAGKDLSKHLGYACDGRYVPAKGETYKGVLFTEVEVYVTSVSFKRNTVYCKVLRSKNPWDRRKKMAYILKSFTEYYNLVS
jgi:hypothetical protein